MFINVLILCSLVGLGVSLTERPIIGIMTMELEEFMRESNPGHDSYMAASYVKAVESSGARAVPIFIGRTDAYYRKMAESVNGLLIPGGGAKFAGTDNFFAATKTMYNIALEMNAKNIHFPVLAVCLGFQLLLHFSNNDKDLRKRCNIIHTNMPINFASGYKKGYLFKALPKHLSRALQSSNITIHNHVWCHYPEDFEKANLGKDLKILSTTKDFQGVPFISAYEHKKYPVGAVLFHPEKNIYEWGQVLDFPRSANAIAASRFIYDWLIREAKKNDNSFDDLDREQDSLVYNFAPTYSDLFYSSTKTNFTQTYLFRTRYMDVNKCS